MTPVKMTEYDEQQRAEFEQDRMHAAIIAEGLVSYQVGSRLTLSRLVSYGRLS